MGGEQMTVEERIDHLEHYVVTLERELLRLFNDEDAAPGPCPQ